VATLLDIRGCLKDLRYDENSARRRYQDSEDAWQHRLRSPFAVDIGAITASKAWRRLQGKTQLFFTISNRHVRNRLTHSLEVVEFAVAVCDILGLNSDLARAIALMHDFGHLPGGHLGERVLSKLCEQEIKHEVLSVVIAQHIERGGKGLNLTYDTLMGALKHSRSINELVLSPAVSAEANVVMFADKICYILSDANDAVRCIGENDEKVISLMKVIKEIGSNQRDCWRRMITAFCLESAEVGNISFSKAPERKLLDEARKCMNPIYKLIDLPFEESKIKYVYQIAQQFSDNPVLAVALMTGTDVDNLTASVPQKWLRQRWEETAAFETLSKLPNPGSISLTDPDLDW